MFISPIRGSVHISKSLFSSICAKRMHICRSLWCCSVCTSLGPFKHIQTPCGMSAQLVGSCIATSHIGLAGHVRTGHPTRIGLLGNRLIWLDATKSLISLSLSSKQAWKFIVVLLPFDTDPYQSCTAKPCTRLTSGLSCGTESACAPCARKYEKAST